MSQATSDGRKGRVLLVDETSDLAAFAESALEEGGYAVTAVGSAGKCLAALDDLDVVGIVSAAVLPDLDGLQLLRSIRISYPTLPFILAPVDGSETLAGDALAAGVTAYVPRSADPETIVDRLARAPSQLGLGPSHEDEQHHRYRHLIEMSPAPINIFDATGDSIWCNPALLDMFEIDDREEWIGTSIFDVIHPEDRELARREVEAVIEEEQSTGPTNMRLMTPSGTRYIQVSTAIGEFLGTNVGQAIAVDVTDREERDRQLQALDQWLRHNIRNEMNVIQGRAADIRDGRVDDVETAAADIDTHVTTLLDQTDHVREVIDMLSADVDRSRTVRDLELIVREEVAAAREVYPDAELTISSTASADVEGVPQLRDAVRELIANAVEHNDALDPTVDLTIVTNAEADSVRLRVADNGPGIPPSERECLLIDREIDELHHSSGLGLVLVYWAVRLSGGHIDFATNDPRGSVIECMIPAA